MTEPVHTAAGGTSSRRYAAREAPPTDAQPRLVDAVGDQVALGQVLFVVDELTTSVDAPADVSNGSS